jgi:hypothetical protein
LTERNNHDKIDLDILKRILNSRKSILRQCYTGPKLDKSYDGGSAEHLVYFTHILLNMAYHHGATFGYFGVSSKENYFIFHGAHPVCYYMNHMYDSINRFAAHVFEK